MGGTSLLVMVLLIVALPHATRNVMPSRETRVVEKNGDFLKFFFSVDFARLTFAYIYRNGERILEVNYNNTQSKLVLTHIADGYDYWGTKGNELLLEMKEAATGQSESEEFSVEDSNIPQHRSYHLKGLTNKNVHKTRCETTRPVEEGETAILNFFLSTDPLKTNISYVNVFREDNQKPKVMVLELNYNNSVGRLMPNSVVPGYEYAGIVGNNLTLVLKNAKRDMTGAYYVEDTDTPDSSQWEKCFLTVKVGPCEHYIRDEIWGILSFIGIICILIWSCSSKFFTSFNFNIWKRITSTYHKYFNKHKTESSIHEREVPLVAIPIKNEEQGVP